MVHRNIKDIELPDYIWQPTKPTKTVKPNRAMDGETGEGFVRLMADSNGRKIVANDLISYLSFLNQGEYRETVNWFYNLQYDTNSMLKYLDRSQREEVITANKIQIADFMITIIPNKELKISKIKKDEYNKDGSQKIHHSTFFYDLAQFYDFKRLKDLAKLVNMEKVEVEDIQNIDWNKYQTDEIYHTLINDRCIIDCQITKALADKLTIPINELVVINKYKSKASIARKYVLENLKKRLTLPDYGILQASLDSYHAGHIEIAKMGLFKSVYNADLNSAYPAAIANLYETEGAYLRNRNYEPEASYSYYLVIVDYDNSYLSPLWFNKGGNNYHVTGKFETWITKSEYELLNKKGIGLIIKKAHHIIKTSYTIKPFENIIHDLYKRRLEAKTDNDPIEKVIKVILNSIYGVTINTVLKYDETEEDTDIWIVNAHNEIINYKKTFKATNMYNPLYGCETTAKTRVKIFDDFWDHLKNINAISTDGIYLSKKPRHIKVDKELGNYSVEKIPKYLLLGSGRYFVLNPDDTVNNDKSRFRSISMKPDKMFGIMDVNRDQKNVKIPKTKVIKLKESNRGNKYFSRTFSSFPIQQCNEIDLFNTFQTVTKKVNFFESRRVWDNEFETIQDVFDIQLESRPYNVSELK
jgi:hypothetical protein